VRHDRPVLILLLMVGVAYVVLGSLELLNVAFATGVLKGEDTVSGLVIGAVGVGLFLGSLAAAGLALRAHLSPVIITCYLASGIPLLFMSVTGSLTPALLWLAVCGAGLAGSSVAVRTLLQRTTDGRVLGRVFAVQEALMMLGLAIGAVVAPLCLTWFGTTGSYVAVGIGLIVIALIATPWLRMLDLRAVLRPDVLRAIRRVPFLAALRPPAVERLSQSADWLDIGPDVIVINQGDRGDAFYVIDRGRLSVIKDGVRLSYDMEEGDGFGELALLRDAPRAATITSLEPCRLLRIERDDFLAALTGVADGAEIARDVASAWDARADEKSV
jgi:MFS family permease